MIRTTLRRNFGPALTLVRPKQNGVLYIIVSSSQDRSFRSTGRAIPSIQFLTVPQPDKILGDFSYPRKVESFPNLFNARPNEFFHGQTRPL